MQNTEAAEQFDTPGLDWAEDLDGLTVDELRELPNDIQLGMDLSIFD